MKFQTWCRAIILLLSTACVRAQNVPPALLTGYTPLDEKLAQMVSVDAYSLSPDQADSLTNVIYLDARSKEEYNVSHLPQARYIGYDDFDISHVENIDKEKVMVVYCTIGYRSERIAERLRQEGFKNVYNLYGSLYAWKLSGRELHDLSGQVTHRMHTYNRKWGKFIPDTLGQKVY